MKKRILLIAILFPSIMFSQLYVADTLSVKGTTTLYVGTDLKNDVNGVIYNDANIKITGNVDNSSGRAMIAPSTGNTELNGTTTQTISGDSVRFNNLTLNNNKGFKQTGNVVIGYTCNFTSGVIANTAMPQAANGVFIYSSTATSPTINTASVTSYVRGTVRAEGTNDFLFPIGDSVTASSKIERVAPCQLTSRNGSFDAKYNRSNAESASPLNAPLQRVSSIEQWIIEPSPSNTTPNSIVTLYWDANSMIDFPLDMTIAHYNGTAWDTVTSNVTGSAYAIGNVTSKFPVTKYSPFTLGSTIVDNVLPISLLSFNANSANNYIALDWNTATEHNSDVFELERSTDNKNFNNIATLKAAGNSNKLLSYDYNDYNVESNILYYYRLKMIDFDGTFEYSQVRTASLTSQATIKVYPNPTSDYVNVFMDNIDGASFEIYDIAGARVLAKTPNTFLTNISLNNFSAGVYTLSINKNGARIKTVKLIVRK